MIATCRWLPVVLLVALAHRPALAGPWTPLGPEGAGVRRVVVDPLTPTTLYASTDLHRIYKSTDGGTTWAITGTGLPPTGLAYRLAIDPVTPTTLYAGILVFPGPGAGLYKSIDGGATWSLLPDAPANVRSLAVDPAARVYVGFDGGKVAHSDDGGVTWSTAIVPGPGFTVETLAVDPVNAGTVYAATFQSFGSGDKVYKSTDGGGSFTATPLADQHVAAMALDPVNPSIVYASGYVTIGTPLWKSTDGGASWNPSAAGLPLPLNVYEAPIVVDPSAPGAVYVGGLAGVWKSIDGGASWTLSASGLPSPRINTIAIDPVAPSTLWAGTFDGGVGKTTNAAATWTGSSGGMRESRLEALAIDPANPSTLYVGSASQGVLKTVDGGASWTPVDGGLTSTAVVALLMEPATPTTLYARIQYGLPARTTDGGASWTQISVGLPSDPNLVVNALARDPGATAVLYAGLNADELMPGVVEIYKTVDGGDTWAPTSGPLDGRSITAIAVAPSSGRVYAADGFSEVQVSDDGGGTWNPMGNVPDAVTVLVVHPTDPMTLLAGTEVNGLYRSTNGGASWAATALPHTRVNALRYDAATPTAVYAGTGDGVYVSLDGGATWSDVSGGLDAIAIGDLTLDPTNPSRLFVATQGASAYRRDLAPCAMDADCDDANVCTTDACMPASSVAGAFGCTHATVACPPGGECQAAAGTCNRYVGCQYANRPNNTPCTSDGTGCTADLCQGGVCKHPPAILLSCRTPGAPGASTLAFTNTSPAAAKLTWRWRSGDATSSELGNPFAAGGSGYELCVFDRGGPDATVRFVAGATAPAGGTCAGRDCWTSKGPTIRYRDRERTPDGLDKLVLRSSSTPGGARFTATAKGPNLHLPSGLLAPDVTVQLRRDDSVAACWQSKFQSGIRLNDAGRFRAKE